MLCLFAYNQNKKFSQIMGTADHWLFMFVVLYELTLNYHVKIHKSNSQLTNMYNKTTYTLILITIQSNLLSFVIELFWLKKKLWKVLKIWLFWNKICKVYNRSFHSRWLIHMNEWMSYRCKKTNYCLSINNWY